MKAIIIKTGEVVEIIEKKGGWTTIKTAAGTEKIRNGLLVPHTEVKIFTTPEVKKAEVVAAEAAKIATLEARVEAHEEKKVEKKAAKAEKVDHLVGGDKVVRVGDATCSIAHYFVSASFKTESGRNTMDVNDQVARQLRGCTLEDVYIEAAAVLGVSYEELHAKYRHLNAGMQRMNLGNRMRGVLNQKRK